MKVGATIPRKKGNHSQSSVDRPERHKAYLTLKPLPWDREEDHVIKRKPASVGVGQVAGFEKTFFQLQGDEKTGEIHSMETGYHHEDCDQKSRLGFDLASDARPNR